tara:strand:- start:193 stop:1635 length:1443 start_codon:yes stop_codon:yes gene_type:complete
MADDPRQFSTAELANIFEQAKRSSNREYRAMQRREAGIDDFELPPAQGMLDRSPIVNYARQTLPENLGVTRAGQWVSDQMNRLANAQPQMRPQVNRINALAAKMPLGGWNEAEKEAFAKARIEDPLVRRTTVEAGMVPLIDNTGEVRARGDIGARAAQVAGVVTGDVMSDGARNIWWFINAPQALTNLAADETIQREGYKILDREQGQYEPIIKNRATRMAATLPAVLATSFGVGNVMREEGYKAVLPSEADARVSDNGIAEAGARYFLGRTGGLLPYDEFVKERPDVSKEEYYKYKTYLFDKQTDLNPLDGDFNVGGVVKGTLDGIHGPEVSFLGKSIPALSGMVPIATAIAGSKRGMARARQQLRDGKNGDMIEIADEARKARNAARQDNARYERELKEFNDPEGNRTEKPIRQIDKETLEASENAYQDAQAAVERVTLENALLGGGVGAIAGGVGSSAIESVIRSLKPPVPYQSEQA